MANIFITLHDLARRKDEVGAWLQAGDTVVVTDGKNVLYQLTRPDPGFVAPRRTKPRVFGQRLGGAVMADDFNDPLPPEYLGGGAP